MHNRHASYPHAVYYIQLLEPGDFQIFDLLANNPNAKVIGDVRQRLAIEFVALQRSKLKIISSSLNPSEREGSLVPPL